ncbi:MAG: outer rane lipoproteinsorting protein [Ferruginibacter sp.]|nr:outer rane lipoproteinsorting protein [Ferruginibacter sp.]
MKNLQRVICTLFLAVSVASVHAQTADEIISKHIEAIGGKEKLGSVTSLRLENTMQIMGNDAPSQSTLLVGKGFKSESEFNGQKIVQVITDKGGWAVNPMAGSAEPKAITDEQFKSTKDQLTFEPFLNYAAEGGKVELAGKEKVGNAEAYKINLTTKDGISTSYYIDPTSWYIVKAVKKGDMMGQQMDIAINFSDFKKTDYGITIPYAMEMDFGGQFQLTSKLNKATFNEPVDAAIFEMGK